MDELKHYDIKDIEAIDDERTKDAKPGRLIHCTRVYIKSEADKVIAEKDEETRKQKRALWLQRVKTAKTEIRYWRERLFNEPAATRAGIHGQRLIPRNLVRTIREWLSIWDSVERKCQAKAEEYK